MTTASQKPNGENSVISWAQQNIAGAYTDPSEVAERVRLAAKHCHLIGGGTMCPAIDGHEFQIAVVPINKEASYLIRSNGDGPPKRGIPKSTLMQVAAAAGVSWYAPQRLDDGRDPHYCVIRVMGLYKQIDGTDRVLTGQRDVDVREGSAQIVGKKPGEIDALRANIYRSAETKAKLRAIREAFGIEQAMTESDLEKPFVLVRTVFTGRSNNRRSQELYSRAIAYKHAMSITALFGPGAMNTLPQPSSVAGLGPAASVQALPALGLGTPSDAPDDVDPLESEDGPEDSSPYAAPESTSPRPAVPSPPAADRQPSMAPAMALDAQFVIPGGHAKGTPLSEASENDLSYWGGRIAKAIQDGTSRVPSRDRVLLDAIRSEQKKRAMQPVPSPCGMDELDRGDSPEGY